MTFGYLRRRRLNAATAPYLSQRQGAEGAVMRMHGLSTRRRFALGLAATGAFALASRGLFRFTPADAATRAERNAPIAPVVPKAFEEFGGVRIDNYDWLRDRKDPRVIAYLDAENAYADARLRADQAASG